MLESLSMMEQGRKIFVSYKYADSNVCPLRQQFGRTVPATVRDYVDVIEHYLDCTQNVYKGESDGEDLSSLSDDQIWNRLKDRIYDSSVTIVMISPNMKEHGKSERSQWIPWEISFSLRETTRHDRTSHSNAMLAVVLPDRNGSYDYFFYANLYACLNHESSLLFKIQLDNMFNKIDQFVKSHGKDGNSLYCGEPSYIEPVKWHDFICNFDVYIEKAIKRRECIDNYKITKEIENG